jgi:5-methylcytosine-specific restriction protein A
VQRCGAPAEHVDHIMPVAAGGTDHPSNLQALCQSCNLAKAAR